MNKKLNIRNTQLRLIRLTKEANLLSEDIRAHLKHPTSKHREAYEITLARTYGALEELKDALYFLRSNALFLPAANNRSRRKK